MGAGAVAGQVIGGLLLQADVAGLGWRVIFVVNVPIAIVTLVLARWGLPPRADRSAARLDVPGAVGVTASLGLILLPLIAGRVEGRPWWAWAMLALSVPVMTVSLLGEQRVQRAGGAPMIPLHLFAEKAFNLGLVLSVLLFAAFFSVVFCLALVLQDGLGLNPLRAGQTFGPLGLGFAVASVAARPYVQRDGARVIAAGAALVAGAMSAVILLSATQAGRITVLELAVPMALIGIGNGVAVPTVIGQVLARIQPSHVCSASGVLTTAQLFSSAIGIAAIGGVFFALLSDGTNRADYASSLAVATTCALALVLAAIPIAMWLSRVDRAAR